MDNQEITVYVRSPSLNETLHVETSLDATVISLKKSIESTHPDHPSASDQRIIFSGKLLQDTDTLIDILKKVENGVTPTFHLVVKPSLQSTSQKQQQPLPSLASEPVITATLPLEQPVQTNIPPASLLPGGYQVVFINGQYYLAPVLTTTSQHFILQQQQQQQPQIQPLEQQNQNIAAPQQQQQQQQQGLPRQPFFGLNQFVDRQVNNAQRATSIWLALKLVVVLFMVCQGASIERIFIFHTIAFIFFLYQTGRLRVVFRRVRIIDNNPLPVPQQQQQQEGAEQQQTQEQETRPLTRLDVVKRGIYTFFASLWPSYGVDPRIAQAFENDNNNE